MGRWIGAVVTGLGLLLAGAIQGAAQERVFGPSLYQRRAGLPATYRSTFEVCDPSGSFRLVVENGPAGTPRLSSASVLINGEPVVRPSDLNQQVGRLERSVGLRRVNELEVRLASGPRGGLRLWVEAVMRCLRVRLTEPAAGSVARGPWVLVRGEVEGAWEVGVTVNGVPAAVEGSDFAALLPADPEMTELVAVATTPDGAIAEARQPLTVIPAPNPALSLRATPAGGIAPLTVTFTLSGPAPMAEVALDLEGDGTIDFQGPSLDDQAFTYAQPGVYVPTLTVTDRTGARQVAATLVQVYDMAMLDQRLQAVWQGFKDAVRAGDLARAVSFIHSSARARYQAQLSRLGAATLAAIDSYLTAIQLVEVGFGGAQYEMLRERDGRTLSFAVWFQLDADGLWRLRRF